MVPNILKIDPTKPTGIRPYQTFDVRRTAATSSDKAAFSLIARGGPDERLRWRVAHADLRTARRLKLFWENIVQANFELLQNRLQPVQRQVVFAAFEAVQRRVGKTGLLREGSVGQRPSFLFQEARKLPIQVPTHPGKIPERT